MIEHNWEKIGIAVSKHSEFCILSQEFGGKSKKLAEFKLQELPLLEIMTFANTTKVTSSQAQQMR